jgi:hypothetical protein
MPGRRRRWRRRGRALTELAGGHGPQRA